MRGALRRYETIDVDDLRRAAERATVTALRPTDDENTDSRGPWLSWRSST